MRPPRANPLLLPLVAAALTLNAAAQVKTAVGEAGAQTTGSAGSSFNTGGVTPIGAGAVLSPLSLSGTLSPALSAPALSPSQGLAPSALNAAKTSAASAEGKEAPKKAVAAAPPKTPPDDGPAAAEAGPPGPPPYFVQALAKLGVPSGLTARLEAFLKTRHPGDQDKIYHGLGHSHEVADLAARILDGQNLSAEKKILLILSAALHDVDPDRQENTPARVSATIAHLDANDEARGLLLDFGARYGFTAAQVKALIMATDFALDPVQMKAKQEAFAKAAAEAFPGGVDWALEWGGKLAFADQSSTYVGSPAAARKRVEGLAVEIRAQLEAIGKGPGPSDAVMLAGTAKFLSTLRQSPLFALLPDAQRENFEGVKEYFDARQTPESWAVKTPPPSRGPPAPNPDLASARRFIDDVMGARMPTEREADSLLGDWLDQNKIPRGSTRAAAVRAAIVPVRARSEAKIVEKLPPPLRRHSALLLRIASERGVSVPYIEAVMRERGLIGMLDQIPDDRLEGQITMALNRAELKKAVAAYPVNEQGMLLRAVAGEMAVKGGKSVEEVARDGVFLYADFDGLRFVRGYASRDPDVQGHTIAIYVSRLDGRWKFDGYRQKNSGRVSDASYVKALKAWLEEGGIPARDLR